MTQSLEGIRHPVTHSMLTPQAVPQDTPSALLELDAIIVPASRPAAHLDHAVTLARAAGCWLVVLCSKRLQGADALKFLAARSYYKTIVIDLPPAYSHELLRFPKLLSIKNELPKACGFFTTDLSIKRNLGLVLARMLGWQRIFFLDDDIRDITYPNLQTTVNMLGSFSAAGLWVTDFPDNSIVCHANRMTEGSQDVFVSGAALAVDCSADIGFFPDIYNEDWLFFFDYASKGQLANSGLEATQLCYHPFAFARRAAWQEFGDVIAEGLYTLLHLDLEVDQAGRDYWEIFLKARRSFLEDVSSRLPNAHPEMREEMLLSLQWAWKCLLTIKPDLCERYVQAWRQDLEDWKWRAADILTTHTVESALLELRLTSAQSAKKTGKMLPRRVETAPNVAAGPVTIPRFDTLKVMSERLVPAAVDQEPYEVILASDPKPAGTLVASAANASDNPSLAANAS